MVQARGVFSPEQHGDYRAVAWDCSFISFFSPRVFFSLNVSSDTSWQLLIYPAGEIPELSPHPRSSGKKIPDEEACGQAWAGAARWHSGVKQGSQPDRAGTKQGADERALEGTGTLPGCGRPAVQQVLQEPALLSRIPPHGKRALPPFCCCLPWVKSSPSLLLVEQSRPAICWWKS